MKLHEFAPAPNARRVRLFLAEKKIDIPSVHVDIRGGENLTDKFKAMSPNGRIPFLELDDGTTICESIAICRYLDAAFPTDHSLFGSTPAEIGKVEMWNRIVELQGLFTAFQAFRNLTGIYSDRERCIEAWGEESKLRNIEFLPVLEERLSQSTYLAGEHFSVADISAYIMVDFIKHIDIHIDDSMPSIQRWYKQVSQREAFIEANSK